MKTKTTIVALLLALAPISQIPASESDPNTSDKTLSPYFRVKTGETSTDVMPLKSTNVRATIAGVIADVVVTQTYSNAGGVPLEATYVFPGSTRSAVYGMQMKIGDHVLKAKVQPRQEARQTYEKAKTEGKSTSLLEQQRPNVFQMNVANIMPGDTVEVELRYTELLVPDSGEYSFIYPTVVGPRYSNQLEANAAESDKWVKNPYLMKGEKSPSTFALAVDIAAGMPLLDLRCETHQVKPQFVDPARASVTLAPDDTANNRDFILKYRLADSKIESGLMVSTGEKENFFLLTVQPPKRSAPVTLPPRDYIFVLDVSGSMHGFPIQTAKHLIRQLFTALKPNDTFNVLMFSGGSTVLSPHELPATKENLAHAFSVIDLERGNGGTELLPALQHALALPNQTESARSVIVITDGYVECEGKAFDLIRGNLNRANLFAFGIGSSVNRHLIEGMARAGSGEPFVVTKPDEAEAVVAKFREYVAAPLLTHVALDFGGFDVYDVEPRSVPDLLADRPLVIFGKWKGNAAGKVSLRGKTGAGEYRAEFPVAEARSLSGSNALAYLWARTRIATLADFTDLQTTDERVKEVTNLGLTYNLLTAYTSFVAVDDTVRNPTGNAQTVKQPLPLPAGVENSAVGTAIQTTPEPGTWALMAAVAAVLGARVYHSRKRKCARA